MSEPVNTAIAQPIKICSNCRVRNDISATHCKWCHTNIESLCAIAAFEEDVSGEAEDAIEPGLRQIALDYAIKTHGTNDFRVHRDGPQVVTNAAAEYLRFLKTGEPLKVDFPAEPVQAEQPEPSQVVVAENTDQPADDGDPLMPLFGPQANLNPAQHKASISFHNFVGGLVNNVPRGTDRTSAMQALIAARASVLRACEGEGGA